MNAGQKASVSPAGGHLAGRPLPPPAVTPGRSLSPHHAAAAVPSPGPQPTVAPTASPPPQPHAASPPIPPSAPESISTAPRPTTTSTPTPAVHPATSAQPTTQQPVVGSPNAAASFGTSEPPALAQLVEPSSTSHDESGASALASSPAPSHPDSMPAPPKPQAPANSQAAPMPPASARPPGAPVCTRGMKRAVFHRCGTCLCYDFF